MKVKDFFHQKSPLSETFLIPSNSLLVEKALGSSPITGNGMVQQINKIVKKNSGAAGEIRTPSCWVTIRALHYQSFGGQATARASSFKQIWGFKTMKVLEERSLFAA